MTQLKAMLMECEAGKTLLIAAPDRGIFFQMGEQTRDMEWDQAVELRDWLTARIDEHATGATV